MVHVQDLRKIPKFWRKITFKASRRFALKTIRDDNTFELVARFTAAVSAHINLIVNSETFFGFKRHTYGGFMTQVAGIWVYGYRNPHASFSSSACSPLPSLTPLRSVLFRVPSNLILFPFGRKLRKDWCVRDWCVCRKICEGKGLGGLENKSIRYLPKSSKNRKFRVLGLLYLNPLCSNLCTMSVVKNRQNGRVRLGFPF